MATRLSKEDWYRQKLATGKYAQSASVQKYLANPVGKFGTASQPGLPVVQQFGKRPAQPKQQQKRASRAKSFEIDTGGSKCLDEAYFLASGKGESGDLMVTFVKGGDQYIYHDVPRSVAQEMNDGDVGEVMNDSVIGVYSYE